MTFESHSPIDSELQAAGRRIAAQPVPQAPSISTLEAGAAKHTSRRRLVLSGAAMVILVALAFPLALTMRGSTTVQTVAVGTGQAAAAQAQPAQSDPAQTSPEQSDPAPLPGEADEDVRIQLRSGDDVALTIRVLSGDPALDAANVAAANASEILVVDGLEVWVSDTADMRSVAALVEPTEFVEVIGNGNQLDILIDVLRNGGLSELEDGQGLQFFDDVDGGEFSFDIQGPDFDIEGFFGPDGLNLDGNFEGFDLEDFDIDGDFGIEGFEDFFGPNGFNFDFDDLDFDDLDFDEFDFDDLDGDFGIEGLEDFFGPNGFNLDGFDDFDFDDFDFDDFDGDFGIEGLEDFFGPNGFTVPAELFGETFDGCIVLDHTTGNADEPFRLEIPEGCSSAG